MKTLQSILINGIILFSIGTAAAQNGYNTDGYGRVRRSEVGPGNNYQPSKKDINKRHTENINKLIDKLTKELTLDDLQVIAITKAITDGENTKNIIIAKKDNQDTKKANLKATNENTDREIMSYLSKEQQAKYAVLVEKRKSQ